MVRRRERIATIVLIVLLLTIPVVGGLQFLLLTKASEADVAELHRTAANTARQIRTEITYELAGLASILSTWTPDGATSDVRDLYTAWVEQSRFPGLVKELVIFDHDTDGHYLLYHAGDAGFTEVEPSQIDWIDTPPGSTVSSDVPARTATNPYVLSLPIFLLMPDAGGHTRVPRTDRADLDAIYLGIDVNYLANVVLPALCEQYLGSDPNGFQATVLDVSSQDVVYSTEQVVASDFYEHGDQPAMITPVEAWPLSFWTGSDVSTLPRPTPDETTDTTANRSFQIDNPVVRQWLAIREWSQLPDEAPEFGREEEPPLPDSGFVLMLWHPAGSIERAALSERNQNFLYSCLVLIVFGAVATIFQVLFRRAHRLRLKEQEFVANVTHELRTPVAAMHAVAENLAEGIVTRADRVREYGAMLLDQGKRLRAMIDQTLLYSGLQGSRYPRKQRIDLAELAERVVTGHPEIDRKRFSLSVKPEMPLYRGDITALESIMTNLISNAFKHNPGETNVHVRLWSEVTKKGYWLIVEVEDTGLGIPRSELAHVREPFFRGAATQERQVPGTGLGLNIVQRIVTISGGKLDIESNEGVGTKVTIRLPFEIADEE